MGCNSTSLRERSYCCSSECMDITNDDMVDGITCDKCYSYNYCRCQCKSFIISQKQNCLICENKCNCQFHPLQIKLLKNSKRVAKINGKLVEIVQLQKDSYCCKLKCFKVPNELVRGIACTYCKSINYCKCDCQTWKHPSRNK